MVFSACYFLVLTGGEEGRLFRAHARLSPVSHRRNADKGQRKPSVRRLFLWQPPSQTKDHPDVDVSYLVLDLKEKKREREVEKNRLDGKRGMAGGPVKRAGGKKKKSKPRKNEFTLWRLFDEDRSGLKALPSRLLFSSVSSPWNPRFVSPANSPEDRRTAFPSLRRR